MASTHKYQKIGPGPKFRTEGKSRIFGILLPKLKYILQNMFRGPTIYAVGPIEHALYPPIKIRGGPNFRTRNFFCILFYIFTYLFCFSCSFTFWGIALLESRRLIPKLWV